MFRRHGSASQLRWFDLTEEEQERFNPPQLYHTYDESSCRFGLEDASGQEWLPVGHIPLPTTRLGWFAYHLIHGLWMRYPLHKVVGFALFDRGYEEEIWVSQG